MPTLLAWAKVDTWSFIQSRMTLRIRRRSLLTPYFPNVEEFLDILRQHNTYVGGAHAATFFDWHAKLKLDAKLVLLVPRDDDSAIVAALEQLAGYTQEAEEVGSMDEEFLLARWNPGCRKVVKLVNEHHVIYLHISTTPNPWSPLPHMASTFFMNVVGADHAHSLYPAATLNRRSILSPQYIRERGGLENQAILAMARDSRAGCKTFNYYREWKSAGAERHTHGSTCALRTRFIGDRYTLSVSFSNDLSNDVPITFDGLGVRWRKGGLENHSLGEVWTTFFAETCPFEFIKI